MSIQDDIFDVEERLKETRPIPTKPGHDPDCYIRAFANITRIFGQLEEEVDHLRKQNKVLKSAIKIVSFESLPNVKSTCCGTEVYYLLEHDNFYCSTCNKGQGTDIYNEKIHSGRVGL